MADQHNANIPAMGNTIAADIPDIKENLEFHKDAFQAFVNSWSDTTATDIKPKIVGDADNDTLIQCEESSDEDIIRFDIGGTGNVATLTATGFTVLGVAQGKDITAALHRKIVEIGDWNMDSDSSKSVAHGLTMSKIREVSGIVRNDADDLYSPITPGRNSTVNALDCSVFSVDATNINLTRLSSGWHDSVNYDSTSFNRGWIIILYVD